MKIVVTGSLGHVSKPLTQQLVQQGHTVTVISRSAEKQKDIEALGATAAIGAIEDPGFLTAAFTGADAVYCMLAPGNGNFSDPEHDVDELYTLANQLAHNYVQAIEQSGVKSVVYLSSVGAHTDKGNGIIAFHYHAENILSQLPPDVSLTVLRPVGFYINLLNFIYPIKTQGVIASNYGATDVLPWVSPIDIAAAAAEGLTATTTGKTIRYVASEELSCNTIATILGEAIGLPDLKWVLISDEQMLAAYKGFGMTAAFAENFVAMNASMHKGSIYEDYYRNKPIPGNVKLKDFAAEFAAAFAN